MGLTKLELNFGKVERVDIHEETKNDTKERESSSSILRNSGNLWYVT